MIKLRKYNNFYGSIFIAIFVSYIVYSFFESRNLFSLEFINYMLTLLICIIPMYLLNNYKVKEKYFFNNQIDFNKDLISIIIPVYNVSAFLDRCLTSVCNQSYKNIEVIIVNDGSTDNSRDICEKFVKKDKRFKLYNRENSGVCTARNYGYKKSHGKYIYFFDGDDYLDENTIKVLYDLMITNNVDVSMVGYYYTFENYEKSNENKYNCKYVLNKKDLLNNIIYRGSYAGYTWNKMYKRKLIGNLKFDEKIAYREDMLYNSFYIERVSRGVYYTSPYYHYVQRDSSVVHQRGFNTKLMGHIYSLEQIRENYLKENLNPLIIDYEIIKCCFNFKYRISVSSDSYFKELREINRICKKYYRKIMSNPKLSKLKRYEIILTNKYPEIICNIKMKLFKIWRFLYE